MIRLIRPVYRRAINKKGTIIKELEWTLRNLLRRKEQQQVTHNSLKEPVRRILANKVLEVKPQTVLEIGCGWGQNLHIINQRNPEIQLYGFDINRAAIEYIRKKIPDATVWIQRIENLDTDRRYDVVFTNAALMYISPQDIQKVMENIIKITEKKIILIELLPERLEEDQLGLGKYINGKWSRNYPALLKGHPIKITRIPKNTQLDEGWKKRGAIIEAII